MTCPPFCDTCGGNLGRGGTDRDCVKCLRACRKERIRKEEYEHDNYAHFRLQTRGGAWRYYRKVEPLAKGSAVGLLSPARDGAASAT